MQLFSQKSLSKIEVPRGIRNSKSVPLTKPEENYLNIRKNASPKWDRTRRSKRIVLANGICCNAVWKKGQVR